MSKLALIVLFVATASSAVAQHEHHHVLEEGDTQALRDQHAGHEHHDMNHMDHSEHAGHDMGRMEHMDHSVHAGHDMIHMEHAGHDMIHMEHAGHDMSHHHHHHHMEPGSSMFYKDKTKDDRCPPGKSWSTRYEDGTCICPSPIGVETFGFYWDVVACAFVPNCTQGFVWNSIMNTCVCQDRHDCKERCHLDCDRTYGKDVSQKGQDTYGAGCHKHCERQVWNPTTCQCTHSCPDTVSCIAGTHFDVNKCLCVRNHCLQNVACTNGTHFDEQHCQCVPGICSVGRCREGWQLDQGTCTCVKTNCPAQICIPGYVWSFERCMCVPQTPATCMLNCTLGEHPNFINCTCDANNTCHQLPREAANRTRCYNPLQSGWIQNSTMKGDDSYGKERCHSLTACCEGEVFDHLRCQCVKPVCEHAHCQIGQLWDPVDDVCRHDGCEAPFVYDHRTGLCMAIVQNSCSVPTPRCHGFRHCERGFAFNEFCQCVQEVCALPRDGCCSGEIFNSTTCTCERCPRQHCPGQVWDAETCSCICVKRHTYENTYKGDLLPTLPGFNHHGNVLIADSSNNRVIEVDREHNVMWQFGNGSFIAGPNSTINPVSAERVGTFTLIAAGNSISPPNCSSIGFGCIDSRVFLVDEHGHIVWQYGQAGVFGSGFNQLFLPRYAIMLPSKNILIADFGNFRVIEVNHHHEIVWQYGQTGFGGTGFNQLRGPSSALQLKSGNFLIADTLNNRVIEVRRDLTLIWQYPAPNQISTVLLNQPMFVSRLDNGNTLIADKFNNRIIEVTSLGTVVFTYYTNTQLGTNPNSFPIRAVRLRSQRTLIANNLNMQVIEVASPDIITWVQGQLAFPGHGFDQLNTPEDAKVIGDFTGLTNPYVPIEPAPLKPCPHGYHRGHDGCCAGDDCDLGKEFNHVAGTCICTNATVGNCTNGWNPFTCTCLPAPCNLGTVCGVTAFVNETTCECACDPGLTYNATSLSCAADVCTPAVCPFGFTFNLEYCTCVPVTCALNSSDCAGGYLDPVLCACSCEQGRHFDTAPPSASNPLGGGCCVCNPSACPCGYVQDPVSCSCIPEVCPLRNETHHPHHPKYAGDYDHRCIAGYSEPVMEEERCVPTVCAADNVFNPFTCQCVRDPNCVPPVCPLPLTYDARDCACRCKPLQCLNAVFNESTCSCSCPIGEVYSGTACVCATGHYRDPVTNACICPAANCTAPLQVDPATCDCTCLQTCTSPYVLNASACACQCPNQAEAAICVASGGTFDSVFCQCVCPAGDVFNATTGMCQACVQTVLCPAGSHFQSTGVCGCVPNYCPTVNCTAGLVQNQITCQCQPPCTTVCPIGQTADPNTCVCVIDPPVCEGVVCTLPLMLNETACACQLPCASSLPCPTGTVLNTANCTCQDPCPGYAACPAIANGTLIQLNPNLCLCQYACATAVCPVGSVPDALNFCACAPSACLIPGACNTPPVTPICNATAASFYDASTCTCLTTVCTNAAACLPGTAPNPADSCLCAPLVP